MTWLRFNLLTLVALVVAIVLGLLWWHARLEAARARLGQEAAELDKAGVTRAHEASAKTIKALLEQMASSSSDFDAALKKAMAAAPGAKPIAAVQASTGVLPASSTATPSTPAAGADPKTCLFWPGDHGWMGSLGAELQTGAGNRILVQAAEASRIDPDGSKVRLFGGELRSDLTQYLSTEVKPAAETGEGLGFGPLAVCVAGGCSLGGTVALPPWHRLELSFGGVGMFGPPGFSAQLVWRPPW